MHHNELTRPVLLRLSQQVISWAWCCWPCLDNTSSNFTCTSSPLCCSTLATRSPGTLHNAVTRYRSIVNNNKQRWTKAMYWFLQRLRHVRPTFLKVEHVVPLNLITRDLVWCHRDVAWQQGRCCLPLAGKLIWPDSSRNLCPRLSRCIQLQAFKFSFKLEKYWTFNRYPWSGLQW